MCGAFANGENIVGVRDDMMVDLVPEFIELFLPVDSGLTAP